MKEKESMIKNVLVTGGSGRLGNFVCPYLKSQGYNVVSTDQVPAPKESENAKARIPFIKADLLSVGDLLKAILFAKADAVVHLGAIPSSTELQSPFDDRELGPAPGGRVTSWRMEEDTTMKVNTMGMYYVLDACRRLGVKTCITTTSYYAYGQGGQIGGKPIDIPRLPIDEDMPCQPGDTYSLSKYLAEEIMKAFTRSYDMRCVALRLNGVFYYNAPFAKFVYRFPVDCPEKAPEGKGYIDGGLSEHVDARDVARIIDMALQKIDDLPNAYEAFNVWSCTHYTCETRIAYRAKYPQYGDMVDNIKGYDGLFSIEKARKLLGYEPEWTWRKGNVEPTNDGKPLPPFPF